MTRQVLNAIQEKRIFFLLDFTYELIKNSDVRNISRLKEIVESRIYGKITSGEREEIKKIVKEKISEEKKVTDRLLPSVKLTREMEDFMPMRRPRFNISPAEAVIRIPESRLPPEFAYLRPVVQQTDIDLGKLNSLIKDPGVKSIECGGPNKRLVVSGTMGMKPANIILTEEEIEEVIDKFSRVSKIPAHSGVFRVVVGSLILSAVISDVVGTRFMIKKIVKHTTPVPGLIPY